MKLLKIFLLTAFIVAVMQSPALAKSVKCDFINEAEDAVNELYIVPDDESGWGKNLIKTPLNFQEKISFKYGTQKQFYKFKIVFSNGKTFITTSVDLKDANHVDVYFDVQYNDYRISKNSVG